MDSLLISAAVVSLGLAAVMSIVAWKLLRDTRERSAARVAALEAMAFDGEDDEALDTLRSRPAAPALAPAAARAPRERPAPVPPPTIRRDHQAPAADAEIDEPEWDLSLHGPDEADDVAVAPAPQPRQRRYAPIAMPDRMFDATDERGAPGRRWLVLAAVAAVVAAGAGTTWAFRSSSPLDGFTLPSLPAGLTGQAQAQPLELLSLRHGAGAAGEFTITGLVQNPAGGSAVDGVVAVVYLFDDQGRYFASGRAAIEPASIAPGAEAPFTISIADASGVSRYRVGFRREDGGVVAHVDRRGQEPVGTTGDSVEGAGSIEAVPIATRGRVEGN